MSAGEKISPTEKLAVCLTDISLQTIGKKRLEMLFDEGSFVETNQFATVNNLKSVITGYGTIDGLTVYAFSQDVDVLKGAVTADHAQKIEKLYDMAEKTGSPIIGIYDSLGGKIDENFKTLSAYSLITQKACRLSGVVPQISIVLGVCSSSAAMAAITADVVIMQKDAELFMNSPFILKAKNEDALGIGTALAAAKSGTAAIICENDEDAIIKAKDILSFLPQNNLTSPPVCEYDSDYSQKGISLNTICDNITNCYDIYEIINSIADEQTFTELYAQYASGAVTGFASILGQSVGIIATNKKQSETLSKDECVKIARFVNICDSYSLAIVTLIDSKGFEITSSSEAAGAVKQASMLAFSYAQATCAKVAVILGEAIGPCYISLAGKGQSADFTFAWPSAVISSVAPKTAAEILYG
ncbi:MAG: carboxyl transferase domain-containing protein, partial [Oscillospiraceae bacterium]